MKVSSEKTEFYEKNLDRINYWLQFAEAKNAAVIAFVVAILAVIWTSNYSDNACCMVIIISIFYITSLVTSLYSFYPQGKNININDRMKEYREEDNLLFWDDIAKYSLEDYIKCINNWMGLEKDDRSKIETMYVEEIITNARIAKKKYKCFKWSVVFSIIGTILIILMIICHYI